MYLRIILYHILTALIVVANTPLQAQDRHAILISGFVTDTKEKPVQYVTIMNLNKRTGTVSGAEGSFRILAQRNDAIRFTSVGFQDYTFTVPATFDEAVYPLHIYLNIDTVELTGVTIRALPRNLTELRQAVLNHKVEEPVIPDLNLNTPLTDLPHTGPAPASPAMLNPGLTYTISGPITKLYNKFSRRGKSLQKFEELTAEEKNNAIISKKYNPEIVKQLTGFASDAEILDFIEYCALSKDFLLTASELEILTKIKECLANYLAEGRDH
ncbi:MAG TPA: carboxypeptidase-like regulatory domain-containing protein [Bacteroidales bacterium]|nr:carboxypeptidase-like regulatory domain-containing protein [Bacteroidales bacterium]